MCSEERDEVPTFPEPVVTPFILLVDGAAPSLCYNDLVTL